MKDPQAHSSFFFLPLPPPRRHHAACMHASKQASVICVFVCRIVARLLAEGPRDWVLLEQMRVAGGVPIMPGRSRMTIDPRIPTMQGRSPSGFHRPGRHR
ncbi:unnamed protein product [Laminaria digitata]